jgi:hypothetical protein
MFTLPRTGSSLYKAFSARFSAFLPAYLPTGLIGALLLVTAARPVLAQTAHPLLRR